MSLRKQRNGGAVCPVCSGPHTLAQQYDDGDPRPYDFCRETGKYVPTRDPGPPRPDLFGRARMIRDGLCSGCGESLFSVNVPTLPRVTFRDRQSAREHRISGLCQACQDDVFGTERDHSECSGIAITDEPGHCRYCGADEPGHCRYCGGGE